jgi:hypothetical protein
VNLFDFRKPEYKTIGRSKNESNPKSLHEFEIALFNNSIHDFHFKGVFYLLSDYLSHYIMNSKGQILQRIIKVTMIGSSKVFVLPHNHRFFEIFNKKTEQMITAGLINHFNRESKHSFNQKGFAPSSLENFKPMTLEHLEAGFVVWIVTLMFPIAAFVFEWIVKCIVDMKIFIVFRCVFLAYLRNLEDNIRIRDQVMEKSLMKIEEEKEICKINESNSKSEKNETNEILNLTNVDEISKISFESDVFVVHVTKLSRSESQNQFNSSQ